MSNTRHIFFASTLLLATVATPAMAQNEAQLKDYFEGRRVTLRMDMPGTQKGVNVHVDSRRNIDFADYGDDLRRYGIAIREGDTVMITKVKVKDDLIEFQLAGGGFGTFWDDTDTSVYIPYVQKSERERSLERRIRLETNRTYRRQLERELDSLRDRRDRSNRRIQLDRERLAERKYERVLDQRLDGGARFNLRFQGRVPYNIRPEDVMDMLAEYVDFYRR